MSALTATNTDVTTYEADVADAALSAALDEFLAIPEGALDQAVEMYWANRPHLPFLGQDVILWLEHPVTASVRWDSECFPKAGIPEGVVVTFTSTRRGSWIFTPEAYLEMIEEGSLTGFHSR